jgi:flagellar biosynthesis protein FlhG
MLGIRYPARTLDDFIARRVERLEEVVIDTPLANVRLISGGDDIINLANPKWAQKTRLLRHLDSLEADHILLDLGAGTGFNALDFFIWAGNRIAVFTPQATSLQNAYGFIKTSLLRRLNQLLGRDPEVGHLVRGLTDPEGSPPEDRLDSVAALVARLRETSMAAHDSLREELASWRVWLVANMVRERDGQEAARVLSGVSINYLNIEARLLGAVPLDREVERHINNLLPILQGAVASQATQATYSLAGEILRMRRQTAATMPPLTKPDSAPAGPSEHPPGQP